MVHFAHFRVAEDSLDQVDLQDSLVSVDLVVDRACLDLVDHLEKLDLVVLRDLTVPLELLGDLATLDLRDQLDLLESEEREDNLESLDLEDLQVWPEKSYFYTFYINNLKSETEFHCLTYLIIIIDS